ncbi:GGDEF domain-containing protein [Thermodesulfovibrio sp. 1176]|uniref:diguanylate cyclase n=1 Tax=Thermodesulfovibrio sp. 1176 TaxID=3043424 RepID=UPI002482F7E6|nr:GGDEF domain-containing protein [Thermodesulfovibrio sp. 1176]MDI1472713.1 GGDEF domain-containing protein [Thermodesulfovibrio sp. 1176]
MDRILILVSNKKNYALLKQELQKKYIIVKNESDIQTLNFDLIIIDGVELKKRQTEITEFKNKNFPLFLPVILLTTKEDLSIAEKFLYEVVDDLIRIPIEKLELRVRMNILLRMRFYTLVLSRETVIDPLTDIYNKKFFYEMAQKEFDYFKRYGRKFSLLFIDIDDFKKINDRYGHLSGDMVLQEIAKRLQKAVRKNDMVFRFGGEEFVVLLHGANSERAISIAERIRQEVANEEIKIYEDNKISITISCGVATVNESIKDVQELVDRADIAMYKAKQSGKNRVSL